MLSCWQGYGILGAIGSCFSFIATFTIIPFLPNAWTAPAGGFPAMSADGAFLMKDLVLFAASFYLLRQDVMRVSSSSLIVQSQESILNEGPRGRGLA